MTRKTLALASVLALAGCGGGGLEVSGTVSIEAADTHTGFNFPQAVRLDGGAGLVTGSCVMTRNPTGAYGVVVDLYSSDTNAEGREIRSLTVMMSSNANEGHVEAQLGQDDFENAACDMHVLGLDAGSGQVSFQTTSPCTITGPDGETATVEIDLGLVRCGVQ